MTVVIDVLLVVVLRETYRLEGDLILVIGNRTIRLLLIFRLHRVRLPLLVVRHYIQMEIFPNFLLVIVTGRLELTIEAIFCCFNLKRLLIDSTAPNLVQLHNLCRPVHLDIASMLETRIPSHCSLGRGLSKPVRCGVFEERLVESL